MKVCQNCGLRYPDQAAFCSRCGKAVTTLVETPAVPMGSPVETYLEKPKKKGRTVWILIAAIVVLAVVLGVAIGISLGFGGSGKSGGREKANSARAVAEMAVEYRMNGEAYSLSRLYHEKYIEENDMDTEAFKDECREAEEEFKQALKELEEEEGKVNLSYEINDEDDVTGDELDDIQEYYDDEYDLQIEEAKVFEVELCMDIDGEVEENDATLIVIKIDGKWYLSDVGGAF